jgi:hypothetical protein
VQGRWQPTAAIAHRGRDHCAEPGREPYELLERLTFPPRIRSHVASMRRFHRTRRRCALRPRPDSPASYAMITALPASGAASQEWMYGMIASPVVWYGSNSTSTASYVGTADTMGWISPRMRRANSGAAGPSPYDWTQSVRTGRSVPCRLLITPSVTIRTVRRVTSTRSEVAPLRACAAHPSSDLLGLPSILR